LLVLGHGASGQAVAGRGGWLQLLVLPFDIYLNNWIIHAMKPLKFMGDSQRALADFPEAAKREAGFELWQVQLGLMPSDFKPMPTVGQGAYEIRVKVQGQWRVIYVAKQADAVYVLHCFHKTTAKTAQADIDLAAKRYTWMGAKHGKTQN
jgi:phage-related protein